MNFLQCNGNLQTRVRPVWWKANSSGRRLARTAATRLNERMQNSTTEWRLAINGAKEEKEKEMGELGSRSDDSLAHISFVTGFDANGCRWTRVKFYYRFWEKCCDKLNKNRWEVNLIKSLLFYDEYDMAQSVDSLLIFFSQKGGKIGTWFVISTVAFRLRVACQGLKFSEFWGYFLRIEGRW